MGGENVDRLFFVRKELHSFLVKTSFVKVHLKQGSLENKTQNALDAGLKKKGQRKHLEHELEKSSELRYLFAFGLKAFLYDEGC